MAIAGVCAGLLACNSGSTDDTSTGFGCGISLTGAVSASGLCITADTGVVYASPPFTGMHLVIAGTDSLSGASISVIEPSEPVRDTTFTASPGSFANITVTRSDGAAWSAIAGQDGVTGTFNLVFTSFTKLSEPTGSGYFYTLHGTIDAVLLPNAGAATDTVRLHGTF